MEINKIRFTIFILFNPDVHKIISSLSFSNLIIVVQRAIRNAKGSNLAIIFGKPKIV